MARFDPLVRFYSKAWGPTTTWGLFERDGLTLAEASLESVRQDVRLGIPRVVGPVLDLGCGAGGGLLALRAAGCPAVGLDESAAQLALARERLPNARLVLGRAQDLPFPEAAFGHVLCTGAFFYFQDKQKVVASVRRVLRPGGTLVLDDMVATPALGPDELRSVLNRHQTDVLPTLESLRAWLNSSGFRTRREDDLTPDFVKTYDRLLGLLPGWRDWYAENEGIAVFEAARRWYEAARRLGAAGGLARVRIVAEAL